MATCRQSP